VAHSFILSCEVTALHVHKMSAEFDFDQWLCNTNMSPDSVDKLVRAKISDIESLCYLSQYDVTALKLEIGDRGKFRRALRKLREQYPDEDEDVLNASTSSKVDDSFDASDPEQVALQQRLQFDSLRKLKANQDELAKEQSRLQSSQAAAKSSVEPPSSQVPSKLPPVASSTPVQLPSDASTATLQQLSSYLSTLNLSLVPSGQVQPVAAAAQGLASQATPLPFALASEPISLQHLVGQPGGQLLPSAQTLSTGAAVGLKPFCNLPASTPTVPFTSLPPLTASSDLATTASLAANPGLRHISDLSVNSTVKDILGIEECGQAAVKKGEKPLLPVDFVSVIPGVSSGEEDILNQHNGIELVLRSAGSKKPTADKLSTGQYFEATNLILQVLLPTFSLLDLVEYIEFQRQIGYYMQIFSVGSVFLLDHLHRKNVFYKGHRWNAIDQCLANGTLKSKAKVESFANSKSPKQGRVRNSSRSVVNSNSGTPCANYNDKNKFCQFNPCRNPHRCSIQGCNQCHPAYKHPSGDSFRKNAESQGGNS